MGRRRKGWLLLCLAVCGCGSQDPEHLARVARKATAKVDALTGGAPGKLAGSLEVLRAAWAEVTPDARVASRLRWDRELADVPIRVQSGGRGVVELTGTVASLEQRRRAVELAETTVGVEKVTDSIEVQNTSE